MSRPPITQADLDAMPEDGVFTVREEIRDGQRWHVPVMGQSRALWTEPDEPCMVCDEHGEWWRIGWADGVRYKRRTRIG